MANYLFGENGSKERDMMTADQIAKACEAEAAALLRVASILRGTDKKKGQK